MNPACDLLYFRDMLRMAKMGFRLVESTNSNLLCNVLGHNLGRKIPFYHDFSRGIPNKFSIEFVVLFLFLCWSVQVKEHIERNVLN